MLGCKNLGVTVNADLTDYPVVQLRLAPLALTYSEETPPIQHMLFGSASFAVFVQLNYF